MSTTPYFTPAAFDFLRELAANNDREWFHANKDRYERVLKAPALRLITDIAEPLRELTPHFPATPKSLFRIHRDTRFSADKRPYKTHAGIHFRHHDAKHAHVPVFYLHLQPEQVFTALGVWHPDPATLGAIRDRIVEEPDAWTAATRGGDFARTFSLDGDRLVRGPKGYDLNHPLIDDLKRKDFVAVRALSEEEVAGSGLPERLASIWRVGVPFMRFVCGATGTPFDP